MTGTVENQMSYPSTSSSSFFGYSFHSVAVLVFLISSALLCSSFSSLLTFTLLILSSLLLFKVRKRKPIIMGDQEKEEVVSEEFTHEKQQEDENVSEEKKESPEGLSSESESIDGSSTSEDSEVDWPFPSDVRDSQACSDDSISDDDSLIEIELREVNCFGPKEEPTGKSRRNLQDILPDSMFPQQDLMGLFAEINEMNEENLIEIDISVGSIKCSRVEIEA